MAFDYGFGPGPVIDPATGQVVLSATLRVYESMDATDPLTVLVAGVEVTEVQAGNDGMLQQFFASVPRAYVEGDGISTRFLLTAYDDVIRRADDAAESAAEASNTMAEALTRTFQMIQTSSGTIMGTPGIVPFATKSAAEAAVTATNPPAGSWVAILDPEA